MAWAGNVLTDRAIRIPAMTLQSYAFCGARKRTPSMQHAFRRSCHTLHRRRLDSAAKCLAGGKKEGLIADLKHLSRPLA